MNPTQINHQVNRKMYLMWKRICLKMLKKLKKHVLEAKEMRYLCEQKIQEGKETAHLPPSERTVTLVGDYSQNIDLPHTGDEQPGECYYMSPVNLYIFGLVDVSLKEKKCKGFTYLESMGEKGGRNVASFILSYLYEKSVSIHPIITDLYRNDRILDTSILLPSDCKCHELNVIMDNCGGQNKNNTVIRLALLLTFLQTFKTVNILFMVKGHTKNQCDHCFNLMKLQFHKQQVWTYCQACNILNTNDQIDIKTSSDFQFRDWNAYLDLFFIIPTQNHF